MLLDEVGAHLEDELDDLTVVQLYVPDYDRMTFPDIYRGYFPESPDNLTVLIEQPGRPPAFSHSDSKPFAVYPRLQILSRGKAEKYQQPRRDQLAIYGVLTEVANRDLSGTFYRKIRALHEPFLLMQDDNQRIVVSTIYEVDKNVGY